MRAPRLRHPRLFALTPESPPCPLRPRYVRELFRLARLGKAAELRAILEKLGRGNPLLQTRDYSGRSLVLTAAREGSVAVVRALLEANPNPNPNPKPDPSPKPSPNPDPNPNPDQVGLHHGLRHLERRVHRDRARRGRAALLRAASDVGSIPHEP